MDFYIGQPIFKKQIILLSCWVLWGAEEKPSLPKTYICLLSYLKTYLSRESKCFELSYCDFKSIWVFSSREDTDSYRKGSIWRYRTGESPPGDQYLTMRWTFSERVKGLYERRWIMTTVYQTLSKCGCSSSPFCVKLMLPSLQFAEFFALRQKHALQRHRNPRPDIKWAGGESRV